MAKAIASHFVVTAVLTDDGAPAYLAKNGRWTKDLQQAFAVEQTTVRDELLAQAQMA